MTDESFWEIRVLGSVVEDRVIHDSDEALPLKNSKEGNSQMALEQSFSRIDTTKLKALIVQKIGRERAEKYFDHLRGLFGSKISKCEFNKFCIRTIGKENVALHNQLIRSIVKNAFFSKVPPAERANKNLNVNVANGCQTQKTCLQSLYGDSFPLSPRKRRSPASRDCKLRDRPSPLGPLGKPQSLACDNAKEQSPTELFSLGSRPPVEVASVEDGEEVEQGAGSPGIQSQSPLTAPFGVFMNSGGSRKSLSSRGYEFLLDTCQNSGELPDTSLLRSRMKRKLEMEGLNVSVDCVNLLNSGLDAYLKRLIEPCMRLAGSRCGNEHLKRQRTMPGRYVQNPAPTYASLSDFRTAMELNPRVLGEDWAVQLEKIGLRCSDE